MALGEPCAVGTEHQRDVRETRDVQVQALRDPDLARGRGGKVGAPDHLVDREVGLVDRAREVVRGDPVPATHHEVVDDRLDPPEQLVVEPDPCTVGADPDAVRVTGGDPRGSRGSRDSGARARIRRLDPWPVRGGRRGKHLRPRAEARIHEVRVLERIELVAIAVEALRLSYDVAIPVDAERAQVVELRPLVLGS